MGNCCRSQSSTLVWAGDDWGSFSSNHSRGVENTSTSGGGAESDYYPGDYTEKQRLLGEKKAACPSSSSSTAGEVKIKMSKRDLDDLMQTLEMQGLSLEHVIRRLMNGEDEYEVEHHRSWRPSLQSIPEDN